MESDLAQWVNRHRQVSVVLPDEPEGDWRAESGYGWIFKAWFGGWRQSWAAREAIRKAGWDARYWGRKLRVNVNDGYDGGRLTEFVLRHWPSVRRIQLRCD